MNWPALLPPLLVLLLCGIGLLVVASLSDKRKALLKRIESNIPRAAPTAHSGAALLAGRTRPTISALDRYLNRFVKLPLDLPHAHLIAPAWAMAIATAIGAAAVWLGLIALPIWAALLGFVVVWLGLLRAFFSWETDRYRTRLLRQMPDTVQVVISATAAGLPVSASFRIVMEEMPAPTRWEFERVVDEMALGVDADAALLRMHERTGVTEYAIFAVTIGVQARSGGRLAETISNLAETVRDRIAIAGKARAVSTEARTSATLMTILPIITGGLMSLTRPDYLAPLLHDPRGQRLLVIGAILLAFGTVIMRQMIRGAARD